MYEQQFNPYGGNLSIVKGYFRSGKILTLGILYIISVVLTFIMTASVSYTAILYRLVEFLSKSGISVPSQIKNILLSSSASTAIGTAIGSSIIPIITAVAFIILFAKSRNASENSSPIAGATILHVLAVISLVFTIIGVVAISIIYIVVFAAAVTAVNRYASSYTGGAVAILIFLGVIVAVYAFISIFYAVSCKNFYRSVKRSMTTSELESKGAVPYGVFSIISAVFSIFAMIYYMVISPASAGIIFICYVVTILVNIFTAIMTLGYNKYINRQKMGINTAPYGAAPVNTAPGAPYNMPDYAAPQPQTPPYQNPVPPVNEQQPYNAQPQPQAMYCPNCGAKTEPGAPFCPNCGTKL